MYIERCWWRRTAKSHKRESSSFRIRLISMCVCASVSGFSVEPPVRLFTPKIVRFPRRWLCRNVTVVSDCVEVEYIYIYSVCLNDCCCCFWRRFAIPTANTNTQHSSSCVWVYIRIRNYNNTKYIYIDIYVRKYVLRYNVWCYLRFVCKFCMDSRLTSHIAAQVQVSDNNNKRTKPNWVYRIYHMIRSLVRSSKPKSFWVHILIWLYLLIWLCYRASSWHGGSLDLCKCCVVCRLHTDLLSVVFASYWWFGFLFSRYLYTHTPTHMWCGRFSSIIHICVFVLWLFFGRVAVCFAFANYDLWHIWRLGAHDALEMFGVTLAALTHLNKTPENIVEVKPAVLCGVCGCVRFDWYIF